MGVLDLKVQAKAGIAHICSGSSKVQCGKYELDNSSEGFVGENPHLPFLTFRFVLGQVRVTLGSSKYMGTERWLQGYPGSIA